MKKLPLQKISTAPWLIRFEYEWLLPALGWLPPRLAISLSNWRGRINARLQRDWRSLALGYAHVAPRTAEALRLLRPSATPHQISKGVCKRYQSEAREELEGQWSRTGRVSRLPRRFARPDFPERCRAANAAGQGVVLLTGHYASALLGIVFLAQTGLTVNAMSSAITHDPRVPRPIQEHFYRKYRSMERWMNGGRIIDIERGLRPFYRQLERGECLVVLGDGPPLQGGAQIVVDFLGGPRCLAGGAWRLAKKTGSLFGSFVCQAQEDGSYLIDSEGPWTSDDAVTMRRSYDFLSRHILACPERWWASDLLLNMPIMDAAQVIAA